MKHLKPYLQYKDSGIKWLRKIPAHWKITRFKYGINLIESGKRDLVEHSDYLSIGGEHIGTNYKLNLKNLKYISEEFYNKNKRGRVQIGDILIVKDGATIGKTAYVDAHQLKQKMLLNEHVYRIVAHKYIYHFVLSLFFQSKIWSENNSSAQEGLNLSTIRNIPLLKPLKEEQEFIADFLDKKTSKIDSLVKKKEKQIELLKEKRLALITQAVTKGLHPDIKMKKSGIEWLGKIPAHWNLLSLKYVTKFKYGDSLSEINRISGNISVYGSNGVIGSHDVSNTKQPVIVIGRKGSFGKVHYCNKPIFAIDTTFYVDSTSTTNNIKWLYYCLQWLQLDSYSKDSAVPGLAREDAYDKQLPFCDPNEQKDIVDFLDKKTSKIDSLIEKIEKSITLLKEYRKALITSAVTGKIDVRELQKIKDNIIPLQKMKKANPLFKTAVLGAEIVAQMKDSPHFGRTKFMKTLYLCEAHLQMPLQGKYKREAAGPLDNNLYKAEGIMKKQGWFKTVKIGSMYKYKSLQSPNGYKKYFDKYWNEYQDKLNSLLSLVKKWTTEQSEIIDTVFAVWNDLLIENKTPSDEEIIYEVKHNWHYKKQRFSDNRLKKAIKWMKENHLIPQGYGLKTFTIKGKIK